ncbi:HypC/HybG/HupF family hydrogenase formation chaperone [Demequina capsici]|uniref:HypC/HybG/HupF family hydrogenase formation chaperone n=1 Tax=Demequina capsici TaxID=3075620 RepID=A0AA96FAJ0_9MICO|nr:HypC/HybG/HupF family hydrogenase formation chaperone [Demequina sp. PMTSA13]WNM26377.1 HypC/HybG/HupF family hydrogenase formation chaperone [Demequina sp. PMTSA13]
MCLGEIAQIVQVYDDGSAVIDSDGRRREVLDMTPTGGSLAPGDWVVVHSGFALGRLTAPDAADALSIRATHSVPPRHGLRAPNLLDTEVLP